LPFAFCSYFYSNKKNALVKIRTKAKVQLANAQVKIRTQVVVAIKGKRGDNCSDTKYSCGAGLAVSLWAKGNRQKLI